jgi:release factor glutamine methyltransferase
MEAADARRPAAIAVPPTVASSLELAVSRLRAARSPTARLDAEVLLARVTERDRTWVLAHPEAELDPGQHASFSAAVDRRAAGEPIAYIRGFKEWHSLRIATDPRALIPRPETELLADAALAEVLAREAAASASVVVWEVGTGSGAVAVMLAKGLQDRVAADRVRLIATDISPEALALAAENLAAYGVEASVTLAVADLLEPAGGELPLADVIVANLPYVASAEVDGRHGSLGFEPRIAVDGGADGLEVLRRLFSDLASRAAPGATVLLETGIGQAEAVRSMVPEGATVRLVPDLAGLDRVVQVQLP